MPDDDDRPRRAPVRLTILPLDTLGFDELDDYLADLKSEIARVEATVARKRGHRSQADAVFGNTSPEGAP